MCLSAQSLTARVKCVCTRKTSESSSAFKIWAKAVDRVLTGRRAHAHTPDNKCEFGCLVCPAAWQKTKKKTKTDMQIRTGEIHTALKIKPLTFSEKAECETSVLNSRKSRNVSFFFLSQSMILNKGKVTVELQPFN